MTLTKVTLRELTPEEHQALEQLASSRTAQARFVERARILVAIAGGRPPSQVAKALATAKAASLGTLGESQRGYRPGLRW